MSSSKPNLDELIAAQRASGGMSEAQRTRNRAQLLSRALAGSAASAAAISAASPVTGVAPAGALGAIAKVMLCVALVGGAGVVYLATRGAAVPPAPAAALESAKNGPSQPSPALAPLAVSGPSEAAPVAAAPAEAALVEPAPDAPVVAPADSAKPHAVRPATSSAPSLAAEVALMHDVDAALRAGHPETALALLDQQRNAGAGFMAEERSVAHIVTLCQLGRVDQARAEATRFLRDRPRSPLAARVRNTCAKPAESGKPG